VAALMSVSHVCISNVKEQVRVHFSVEWAPQQIFLVAVKNRGWRAALDTENLTLFVVRLTYRR